jgi:hypothetical protein
VVVDQERRSAQQQQCAEQSEPALQQVLQHAAVQQLFATPTMTLVSAKTTAVPTPPPGDQPRKRNAIASAAPQR